MNCNATSMTMTNSVAEADGNHLQLLTVHETAAALRISERKLWSLTQKKGLACVRIGRRVLYDPQDLQRWIDRQKGGNR